MPKNKIIKIYYNDIYVKNSLKNRKKMMKPIKK
jgi:hypothetical protein